VQVPLQAWSPRRLFALRRLEGTNVEQGRKILQESGLNFTIKPNMKEAAEAIVALAK
jgi:succinyl-CoA synthetase beta subunit